MDEQHFVVHGPGMCQAGRWILIRAPDHDRGHEVIVNTMAATTTGTGTGTGRAVHAALDPAEDPSSYRAGIKIPDQQMQALSTDGILHRHDFHGEWNNTRNPPADAVLQTDRPIVVFAWHDDRAHAGCAP